MEQRGLYITLLCLQWDHGEISLQEWQTCSTAIAPPLAKAVLAKFKRQANGGYKNSRLEEERDKQSKFRATRSESGKAGANSRWHSHSSAMPLPMANDGSPSPSPSPIAERVYTPEVFGRPKRNEVLSKAQFIGLAEWKANDWFDEMEGCGWLDHQHRPIADWTAVLTRVCRKWESDGRPASPPKPKKTAKEVGNSKWGKVQL